MAKKERPAAEARDEPAAGVQRLEERLSELAGRLDRHFEETGRLAQASEGVTATAVYADVLDSLRSSFESLVPFSRLGFSLLDEDSVLGAEHWMPAGGGDVEVDEGLVTLDDSGLSASLQARQPLIIRDLDTFSKHHEWHGDSSAARRGMRSALACPLVALSRWIGFLFFYSDRQGAYDETHQQALAEIAEPLAMIFEKSRLYDELIELNRDLAVVRQALEYQTTHDPLTGLWSRTAIIEVLGNDLARSRRDRRPTTAVIADIDALKRINAEHGYAAGDAVIRGVADRLAATLRSYESIGRYAGEEFLIALYSCDERGALRVIERLADLVMAAPIDTPAGQVSVTVSMGAAVSPPSEEADAERVIRAAEEALGSGKSKGPNHREITTLRHEEEEEEEEDEEGKDEKEAREEEES